MHLLMFVKSENENEWQAIALGMGDEGMIAGRYAIIERIKNRNTWEYITYELLSPLYTSHSFMLY